MPAVANERPAYHYASAGDKIGIEGIFGKIVISRVLPALMKSSLLARFTKKFSVHVGFEIVCRTCFASATRKFSVVEALVHRSRFIFELNNNRHSSITES
jgi:hypothetical protein